MDAYGSLLERTRLPQPSLQRYAVIQLFDKLAANPNSEPSSEAITQCLNSNSAAVVDQSVRHLCRLVNNSKLTHSAALLHLISSLHVTSSRFVPLFVKAIGFLLRLAFRNNTLPSVSLHSLDTHPFIQVVSCRPEVRDELVQQLVLFVVHAHKCRFSQACDYIRPLLTYSVSTLCSSGSSLLSFLTHVVSSLVSVYCSLLHDTDSLFDMLVACLRCFPSSSAEDQMNLVIFAELLVDAHIVKLQRMLNSGLMGHEAQLAGIHLLDDLLTLCMEFEHRSIGSKPILSLSRRLLSDHKKLGLRFIPELFRPVRSLFIILAHLELEDEKLFILEFLAFILKWDVQDDNAVSKAAFNLCEVRLFFFPVISLMSSPSKSVKQAASRFILLLEKLLGNDLAPLGYNIFVQREAVHVSKPETIIFRLLQHLWLQDLPCGSFYLNVFSSSRNNIVLENGSSSWLYQLKEYASWNSGRQKSSVSVSSTAELISPEMPLLLGAVVASLVMHHSLEFSALDLLASLGEMEPKLGVTLLLGVLYYSNFLRETLKCSTDTLLKLLRVLPSLASHSAMQPLIVQTVLPMLQKDSNRILYATALRLLCKAWEMNYKVFGTLQVFLLPECFREFGSDRTVVISMAACLRDICRQNPDKGIELILSIAGCIECRDAVVQALGLQSLGFLCEADAVDFYTAWDVVANHVKEYLAEPVVAYSLCALLRWGSTDAEAYTEASGSVLQLLWNIGSHIFPSMNPLWKKARITAFVAINHFEVSQIQNSLPDLMVVCMELLVSETDVDILKVIGELKTKIIAYEHSTRRRMISEKKAPRSKIEKLLDVFPRVVFSSGRCNPQDMPGAALFCLPVTNKDSTQGNFKNADDVFDEYRNIVKEVSGSLHLSRNTLLALLSLQSWKSLMKRWLKDYNCVLVKASSAVFDRTSKAANDILKDMINLAEDSIPRMAENISLAIGAYCLILPASAHAVKVTASKFLLGWLSQHEHEHRQWSAAIAIGAISSCLHATDRQQKLQCVSGLFEVSCQSRSSFVKGACSVGLGFACQDLLTRTVSDESAPNKDNYTLQEKSLLGKIVRDLSSAISQFSQISPDLLESLHEYKASDMDYDYVDSSCRLVLNNCDDVDGDIWGVAGLVLGLGLSTSALFRVGSYDAIRSIKLLCTSLVTNVSSLVSDFNFGGPSMLLSIGACLVLPTIASFCRRVDMMHDDELNDALSSYENLISKLITVKTSNTLYQNLLMASCVGGGALLASILGEGLFPLDPERVQNLLGLFKTIYSASYPDLVHLGAFLGVVNTMGADAGCLFYQCSSIVPQTHYNQKESSHIDAPLLSRLSFVENLSALMQDMFLVAQQPDAKQLQAYAAWAISFLREHLWSKEVHGIYGRVDDNSANSKPFDQSFSKDATVVKLSSWLMQLDYTKCQVHVNTVAAVLSCLADAPRLPEFDWGAVIRRCIKYESHVAGLPHGSSCDNKSLLEECLQFSVAHARKFDSLLNLLDDLTCLSRFRTLDIVMQSCLVFHLPDLLRIFSSSRNQMLLEDMHEFLSSPIYSDQQNTRQKRFLQLAFWKALAKCVNKPSEDTFEYLYGMEKCVEVLFKLLPASPCATSLKKEQMPCLLWHESMACLSNTRQACLMSLLQLSPVDEVQRNKLFGADLKKMLSLAKLVKIGSMPSTELGKLKSYMMCTKSEDMWDVLVEVVAALQNTEGARRQWLIDILEISCITKYPSTALHFIGLLSGSSCKYMPFLITDPQAVLLDLPVTLSSLLLTPKWRSVAGTAVSYLWTSTERIYAWATSLSCNGDQFGLHPIEPSEKDSCDLLMNVMVDACYKLREFLPMKNHLRLVNMVQPRHVNS
ncbi:protein RST1-like isoform X1 [Silene latifolia]|uniref:protein RST1-like isoform X1 n=1 Tax=Silene latifolia TaxID=37657 RepID=UPI003D781A3E